MSMLGTVVRNHPGTARQLKSGTGFRKATTLILTPLLMPFEPPRHDLEYGRKRHLSKMKSLRGIIL